MSEKLTRLELAIAELMAQALGLTISTAVFYVAWNRAVVEVFPGVHACTGCQAIALVVLLCYVIHPRRNK